MKYIKKGNKIIVTKDNDNVVGSILTDNTFRIDTQNESIRFENSDFSIDFASLTSITDDLGNTKLKAEFLSFQEFVNYFANSIFFLVSGQDANYKGVFANQTELTTALPTGQVGWFAYVVVTSTYWFWDSTPGIWADSGSSNSPGVILFNGRQGAVEPEAGDYTVDMVTGAAPLESPILTGTPTAPTRLSADNSANIATTEYVKNNLAPIINILPVTIGSNGEQFTTLQAAYNAGFRNLYVTSNCTQNNFLFSQNVIITLKEGVTVGFTPTNSQIFRINVPNITVSATIISEGDGASLTCVSAGTGSAFFSAETNSWLDLKIRGNTKLDFSSTVLRMDAINTNSRILNFDQGGGFFKIKTGNNLSCGISINTTVLIGYFYAENLKFEGLGTSSGFFLITGNKKVFVDQIEILGSYNSTNNLISITLNSSAIIQNLLLNPTVQTACLMQFSGVIQNLVNPLTCLVNVTIASVKTMIIGAFLGGGNLNIDNKTGFKGYGIYDYTATNLTDDTLINSNFAISNTPTPASILSRELKLYLGGANGEVYQFIGNSAGVPVLINTPPFAFSLIKNLIPSVTVNNGTSYNLFTSVTTGDVTAGTTKNMEYVNNKFSFENTNLALLFPPFRNYTDYTIRVILGGSMAGATGSDRQFYVELRRGTDNSLISANTIIKIQDNNLSGLPSSFGTFADGILDPFITGGIRIVLNNTSGTSITLTDFRILIQGRPTNFIQ